MRLQDGRKLRSHRAARLARMPEEILGRGVGRPPEPPLFTLELIGRDGPAERGRSSESHDDRAPDRYARSNRKTVQHKGGRW